MRAILRRCKPLCLAILLLATPLLVSCDVFSAVKKATLQEGVTQNATGTPAPRTPEPTHEPVESPGAPILERAMDTVPFPLLDGRLLLRMPLGTQDIARQPDIMSAEISNHKETRLVLEGSGQQLVVYAQESFYYSDDLDGDVDRILKQWHGGSFAYTADAARQTDDGLRVICYSPAHIDTSVNAVLIRGAVVGLADGTFITVGVYVTPETAADTELCQKQAGGILDTLSAGPRRIDASVHEERLGRNSLAIELDQGYVIVQDEGVDFSVFYLMKFVKLGEPAPSIGIYMGGHPSLMYMQRGVEESELTKTKAKILNKNVEWLSYASRGEYSYSAETYLYLNGYLIMHVFIDAQDEAEFLGIKKMIETLKFRSYP